MEEIYGKGKWHLLHAAVTPSHGIGSETHAMIAGNSLIIKSTTLRKLDGLVEVMTEAITTVPNATLQEIKDVNDRVTAVNIVQRR